MLADGLLAGFARLIRGDERVRDAPETETDRCRVPDRESATGAGESRIGDGASAIKAEPDRDRSRPAPRRTRGRIRWEPPYHVDLFLDWFVDAPPNSGMPIVMHHELLVTNYLLWAEASNIVPLARRTLLEELTKRTDRVAKGRPRKKDPTGRVVRLKTPARSPVRGTHYTLYPRPAAATEPQPEQPKQPLQEAA